MPARQFGPCIQFVSLWQAAGSLISRSGAPSCEAGLVVEHSLGAVHAGHLPLRTLGGCPSHWQAWPAWQGSEDPMRNLTINVLAWQACRAWDTPGGACPIVLSPLPRQLPVAKDHTTQAPYVSDNVIPQPWHSGIHCKLVAA